MFAFGLFSVFFCDPNGTNGFVPRSYSRNVYDEEAEDFRLFLAR